MSQLPKAETFIDKTAEMELQQFDTLLPGIAPAPIVDRPAGFEFPTRLWGAMLACYAMFFGAILAATGGSGSARFAIVISVLYTAVYFGVGRIIAKQAPDPKPSPLDRGKPLATWTGPMDGKAVFGQVLIVPIAVALFGCAILLIRFAI